MADLRDYLGMVEAAGGLARVGRKVSPRYEIAAVTARAEGGPALLFENVEGSAYRVVSNLLGTRQRFAMALGTRPSGIHRAMLKAISGSREPSAVKRGKFMENQKRTAAGLPVVTHFEKEPGPFITSSVVFAANPETGRQNSSFHRMMPLDERRFTIRMVEERHLDRCFQDAKEHGEDLRVAVVVGVHPAVLVAGAYQAGWGEEEMAIANAVLGGNLGMAPLKWSGLRVPADSEVVIEGRILRDVTEEEWMVEMLQTYDHKRRQPVFEVDSVYHRDNPIFHDILSGYGEHRLLMGMPVESKINEVLRKTMPQVVSASLTGGGCSWLHAVVRIRKEKDSDPREVISRTFKAHRSLKMVTVVDEDIKLRSAKAVEYAMATRFQADRDIVVIKGVRGSSLDPSSDQKRLRTAKMGIDATRPLDKRPEGFEVARIPGADDIRLDDYCG